MLSAELGWAEQQGDDAVTAGEACGRAGVAVNDHGSNVRGGCDSPAGRSRSAVAGTFGRGPAELGPGHHFHSVAVAAPAAQDRLDGLLEDLGFLDLGDSAHIHMPELTTARGADDVESGEVAAVGAAPPGSIIWKFSHAETLLNVRHVSPLA